MTLTSAEKQRRYRRHRKGDHSLCDPARSCGAVAEPAAPAAPPASPPAPDLSPALAETFGDRGRQLWHDMAGAKMGPGHRSLLVEACRLADRLDRLDRLLSGGDWLTLQEDPERPYRSEIVVDRVLSEARQHSQALKVIVAQLEPRPTTTAAPAEPRSGGGLAGVTALFGARRGQIATD